MTTEEQVAWNKMELERDTARKDAAALEVEIYYERNKRWAAEAEAGGLRRDVQVLQREQQGLAA